MNWNRNIFFLFAVLAALNAGDTPAFGSDHGASSSDSSESQSSTSIPSSREPGELAVMIEMALSGLLETQSAVKASLDKKAPKPLNNEQKEAYEEAISQFIALRDEMNATNAAGGNPVTLSSQHQKQMAEVLDLYEQYHQNKTAPPKAKSASVAAEDSAKEKRTKPHRDSSEIKTDVEKIQAEIFDYYKKRHVYSHEYRQSLEDRLKSLTEEAEEAGRSKSVSRSGSGYSSLVDRMAQLSTVLKGERTPEQITPPSSLATGIGAIVGGLVGGLPGAMAGSTFGSAIGAGIGSAVANIIGPKLDSISSNSNGPTTNPVPPSTGNQGNTQPQQGGSESISQSAHQVNTPASTAETNTSNNNNPIANNNPQPSSVTPNETTQPSPPAATERPEPQLQAQRPTAPEPLERPKQNESPQASNTQANNNSNSDRYESPSTGTGSSTENNSTAQSVPANPSPIRANPSQGSTSPSHYSNSNSSPNSETASGAEPESSESKPLLSGNQYAPEGNSSQTGTASPDSVSLRKRNYQDGSNKISSDSAETSYRRPSGSRESLDSGLRQSRSQSSFAENSAATAAGISKSNSTSFPPVSYSQNSGASESARPQNAEREFASNEARGSSPSVPTPSSQPTVNSGAPIDNSSLISAFLERQRGLEATGSGTENGGQISMNESAPSQGSLGAGIDNGTGTTTDGKSPDGSGENSKSDADAPKGETLLFDIAKKAEDLLSGTTIEEASTTIGQPTGISDFENLIKKATEGSVLSDEEALKAAKKPVPKSPKGIVATPKKPIAPTSSLKQDLMRFAGLNF